MPVKLAKPRPRSQRGDVVVPSGSLIARYELIGRLGRGGMAEVWLARAIGLRDFEKILVLKRVLRDKRDDPRFIGMLRDEARVAATLNHPNVVHTLDVGLEGDELFIAMEYLDGQTVKSILATARKANEKMPLELAVQVAMGCAAGLHYAHEQIDSQGRPLNIVHRDVSPANVIVTNHSGVKLIDFGIAKAQSRKEQTAVGMLKGKAAYMSPEQCRGNPLDRRSDVFALGIMIYEMTTMARPFEGDSHLAVMHQICNETPPLPSAVRPDYPKALERVVMRALERDVDQRFQSAFELLEALERVTRDGKLHALPGALARYLEHVFGPRPHPWQALRGGLASSKDLGADTTDTSDRDAKEDTATLTRPKMAARPPEGARAASADPATMLKQVVVTERAVPVVTDEELGLAAVSASTRSPALVVAGSVAVAGAIVGLAAWYTTSPTPRAAGAGTVAAAVATLKPTPAAAKPSTLPAPSPETADPVESGIVIVDDSVPEGSPVPAFEPKKRPPADKSKTRRVRDAARLLDDARTEMGKNQRKALGLVRKSVALRPTPEAYSLLGVLACRLSDTATAQKAHARLAGKRRTDLARACQNYGIEL